MRLARRTVEQAGGFEAQLADIEAVAAHHANNYMPLVARHRRRDRATMFAFVARRRAGGHERRSQRAGRRRARAGALAPDPRLHPRPSSRASRVDLSFASEQWQRRRRDRDHPGRLDRRHFEACVFTYLASELRTGDIAVRGSQAYANWAAPATPVGGLRAAARTSSAPRPACRPPRKRSPTRCGPSSPIRPPTVDAGYPENTDLVIDQATGVPSLKRRRGQGQRARARWSWRRRSRSGCPSGRCSRSSRAPPTGLSGGGGSGPRRAPTRSSPDPLLRYVLTTFTYGANLGPAQAARHIRGVSAHELGATAARHFTTEKLEPRRRRRRQRLPAARPGQGVG